MNDKKNVLIGLLAIALIAVSAYAFVPQFADLRGSGMQSRADWDIEYVEEAGVESYGICEETADDYAFYIQSAMSARTKSQRDSFYRKADTAKAKAKQANCSWAK